MGQISAPQITPAKRHFIGLRVKVTSISLSNSCLFLKINSFICSGKEKVASLLILNGNSVSLVDNHGRTPLHVASKYGNFTGFKMPSIKFVCFDIFKQRKIHHFQAKRKPPIYSSKMEQTSILRTLPVKRHFIGQLVKVW